MTYDDDDDAIMIGVKYPKNWRKGSLSKLLQPYKFDTSVIAVIPRRLFDRITSEIENLQGTFQIIKERINLSWNVYKFVTRKGFTKKEWEERFRNVNDFYNSIEWATIRNVVLDRDKYTCQVPTCGRSPSRNVHHKNDPRFHPEMSLDLYNLMVLCDECHDKWHRRRDQE